MLKTEQLIDKLKSKGVAFQECTVEDAVSFLNEHNYYVKVTAYKANFHKHNGKYVGLDFMALKDLSTIDMYLRRWIISASLSVEHSLKVNILKDIQEKNIDEFNIVSEYIAKYPRIITELDNRRSTAYVKTLLGKY
ncbi:CAAX protease, partial [Bifidobacteriaceae bacterium NR016]